jgi:hypothetical protein
VLVQAPERCKNGHFWVLVAPEKHVLFEFSKTHDSDATAKLLDAPRSPGFRSLSWTSLRRCTPPLLRASGRGCPNGYETSSAG